jgi:hypothetical protein
MQEFPELGATSSTPVSLVEHVYARLPKRAALGRQRFGRPLTFAEKVLLNHLRDPDNQGLERGRSYADFYPDRAALQDALAQIVALQFMTAQARREPTRPRPPVFGPGAQRTFRDNPAGGE